MCTIYVTFCKIKVQRCSVLLVHTMCTKFCRNLRLITLVIAWDGNCEPSFLDFTASIFTKQLHCSIGSSLIDFSWSHLYNNNPYQQWYVMVMIGSDKPWSSAHWLAISQVDCNAWFVKSTACFSWWFLLFTSVTVTETAKWTSRDDRTSIEETSTCTVSTPRRMRSTRGQQWHCTSTCTDVTKCFHLG